MKKIKWLFSGFFLLTVLCAYVPAMAATWQPTGSTGNSNVNVLSTDPTNNDTVYVGTSADGMFKSLDGGDHWNQINIGLTDLKIYSMAIDPNNSQTIYVGTETGLIFVSSNGGDSWAPTSFDAVKVLGITPPQPGRSVNTLAIGLDSQTVYAGTYGVGVFKSDDGGITWSSKGDPASNKYFVNALALDPSSPLTVYAATSGGGVIKSTNGGDSWSSANSGLPTYSNATCLTLDQDNSQILYIGTKTRSDDPSSGGVFKSLDGGASWNAVNTGLTDLNIYTLAIVPEKLPEGQLPDLNTRTLYSGTATSGVFMSTDSGASWSPVNSGLTDPTVFSLIANMSPTSTQTLYAGTSSAGVFKEISPAISGTPDSTVKALSNYSFTPQAVKATGFTITGKPDWADFNLTSGVLTGTPTLANIGTYSDIVITATIETGDASLPTFALTVLPLPPGAPTIGSATAGGAQATVTFTVPASNGGADITGYTVTSHPSGGIDSTPDPTALTHIVTGLTNGTAYTFTVTATNSAGSGPASAASNPVTPVGDQTITFAPPDPQTFGKKPQLHATASSGLTPVFSSATPSVCTVTSAGALNFLTFLTIGTCSINADQPGNTAYTQALQVNQSFEVTPTVPDAPIIGTATASDGQASVSFSAPANNGGYPITGYRVISLPAGGVDNDGTTGTTHTVTGLTNGTAYTFTVVASTSFGDSLPSAPTLNPVTPKANQTISFANPGQQTFGAPPTLTATSSAGPGLPPTFTSTTTGVCTITGSGTLTFLSAGTCSIRADQAGNPATNPAPSVSQSFQVAASLPGAPTIGTATAGNAQAIVTFTPPVYNGGAAISGYTVTSSPSGGSDANTGGTGTTHTVTGLINGTTYTFTVTAKNTAGTGPASAASIQVTPQASQTITFAQPGTQILGTSPTLTASASSGLVPIFTSSTQSVCTITSGGALTLLTTGTCTIAVDQVGNPAFLAAPEVVHSFAVDTQVTISGTPLLSIIAGSAYSFTPTAPSATSFTITGKPSWASFNPNTGALTGTPLNTDVGSFPNIVITAVNGILKAPLPAFTITVTTLAAPTISGTPSGAVNAGTSYSFTPTSTNAASFTITGLPSWASFNSATGALTGTPGITDAAIYSNIVITAVNIAGTKALAAFSIVVALPPTISGTPTGALTAGNAYSFTPTATNAASFSIANKPSWAFFSTTTGALTGTPSTANVGTFSGIVISAANAAGTAVSLPAFSIVVDKLPTISGTPATAVTTGNAYSFIPTATGAASFTITGTPSWASFDTGTGALTGTPGSADVGTYSNIVITAVNSTGTGSAAHAAFSIKVSLPLPTISGTPATSVQVGTGYSFTPTATNAAGFTINAGKPSWASFDTTTGTLSGTPDGTNIGTSSNIVINAVNSTGTTPLAAFSIVVAVPATIGGTPASTITAGSAYSFTPTATNAASFSISNKPSWATFSTTTGALTGTPTTAGVGTYANIVISATNAVGTVSLPGFSILVDKMPTISGIPATGVITGNAYNFVPTATGAASFTITGQPSWASFDSTTGALTGTPGTGDVATYQNIVISAVNSTGTGTAAHAAFSIKVSLPLPTISGTPLLNVTAGNAYGFTPTATGATKFVITGKPSWASFDTTSGALTGTPAVSDAGTYSKIVIGASNGANTVNLPTYAIRVGAPGAPFVSDLNGDGKMDIADVLMVLQATVGTVTLTPEQKTLADVAPLNPQTGAPQGDGVVDIADVIMLLRRAIGAVNW